MPKKQLKEDSDSESDNEPKHYKVIDCRRKECYDEAKYNEKGEEKPRYCKKHKRENDVFVSNYFKINKSKSDDSDDSNSDSDSDNDSKDKKFCAINVKPNHVPQNKSNNEVSNESDDDNNNLDNAGRMWKNEDVNKLLDYISKNKTDSQIGKLLGRTERSIICKKEYVAYDLLKTKTIDEIKKITKFTEDEIDDIKKRYDTKNKNKKTKVGKSSLTDSISLIDKLNELATKNMEHFKVTGKTFVSDKLIDSLLSDLKN